VRARYLEEEVLEASLGEFEDLVKKLEESK
jgi:hypothetical protein